MMGLSYNPKLAFRLSLAIGGGLSIAILFFRKTASPIDRYILCYMYQVFFLLLNLNYIIHFGKNKESYAGKRNVFLRFSHSFRDPNYLALLIVSFFYSVVLLAVVSDQYVKIIAFTCVEGFSFSFLLNFLFLKESLAVFYVNLCLFLIAPGAASSGLAGTLVHYNPLGGLFTYIFW